MRTKQLYQQLRKIVAVGSVAALLALLPGCGPELSPDELGTVVFEPPKFDDEPYPLPKLGEAPAEEANGHAGHDHGHDHEGHEH
jgi:hypothetical protein